MFAGRGTLGARASRPLRPGRAGRPRSQPHHGSSPDTNLPASTENRICFHQAGRPDLIRSPHASSLTCGRAFPELGNALPGGLTSEAAYQSVARLGVEHQNPNVRRGGEYSRLRNVYPARAQVPLHFHIADPGRVRPAYGFAPHKRTRLARCNEQDFVNRRLRPISRRECRMSRQVLPNIGLGVCCCGWIRSFYAGLDRRCSRRIGIASFMPRWSRCFHSVSYRWDRSPTYSLMTVLLLRRPS